MTFTNETEAITYVFESLANSNWRKRGLDEHTRTLAPTEKLLALNNLPTDSMDYVVITGSKGKGSTAAILARILRELGHITGMITSPHLTTYRQRFRVDGAMIPEADLVRLINRLQPSIEKVTAGLTGGQYLSPQGIFLALGLLWFAEKGVKAAVIEVGRGGRFDDNALVPNKLSLFTPIVLEHTRYLGDSVERIAWHKAGIIKPNSYAFSLPQEPGVMDVLRREADSRNTTFEWLAPLDMGRFIADSTDGMRVDFGRYGEVDLPLMGRYEIDNASLAIWAAGNMHARLDINHQLNHGSQDYVARVQRGLESVIWPGRAQKIQDTPAVYIDGAINVLSARSFINSVRNRLTTPTVIVLAVPVDRDVDAVYREFSALSKTLVITSTERNITIHFPDETAARAAAQPYYDEVHYAPTVATALDRARALAGDSGTVVMSLAQPAIGDVMQVYGLDYAQI